MVFSILHYTRDDTYRLHHAFAAPAPLLRGPQQRRPRARALPRPQGVQPPAPFVSVACNTARALYERLCAYSSAAPSMASGSRDSSRSPSGPLVEMTWTTTPSLVRRPCSLSSL